MMAITGIVLLAKFVLSGFVGVKLLKIPAQGWLAPERLLAAFFLLADLLGGVVITTAYGVWSSMGRAGSPDWLVWTHALGLTLNAFGAAMIFLFTQRTFKPDSRLAAAVAWSAVCVMVLILLSRSVSEGYAIAIVPGALHWAGYGMRILALGWVSIAAFAYWIRMRKRLKLGLADPMLVNRFLLWGLWALGNLAIAFAEPFARIFYAWIAGDTRAAPTSITDVAGPIIQITLLLTSVFGSITTVVLFLTFFPTEAYRNRVMRGAAASGA
jgi:hypothetical protein